MSSFTYVGESGSEDVVKLTVVITMSSEPGATPTSDVLDGDKLGQRRKKSARALLTAGLYCCRCASSIRLVNQDCMTIVDTIRSATSVARTAMKL